MNKKSIIVRIIISIIIVAVGIIAFLAGCSNKALRSERDALKANEKALMIELSGANSEIREMQMSLSTLELFSDSVSKKLLQAKNSLGIKDKKIEGLQYMLSQFDKKDTVRLSDTIFKADFVLDTMIGDEWLSTYLHLEYPGTICADIEAKSEKEVVVHTKRETVDPPKKFFICKWLQKKHTVTIVDIIEENPHITSTQNRFVRVSD